MIRHNKKSVYRNHLKLIILNCFQLVDSNVGQQKKNSFLYYLHNKKRPDEKRERGESNKHLEINGDDEGRNEEVKGKIIELKQNKN